MTEQRPPLPPFTRESAAQKVRAHETGRNLVCRLLLEKKKTKLMCHTAISDPTRILSPAYATLRWKKNNVFF